jgi:hypothetical protein
MSKPLHAHLVLRRQIVDQTKLIGSETLKVFKGSGAKSESGPLKGIEKSYTPVADDGMKFESEKKNLITTAIDRLNYTFNQFEKLFDYTATRDLTNTKAFADVVIDGTSILTQVPVDTLYEGMKFLTEIRGILHEIPTLDGSYDWRPGEKPGTWVRGPVITYRREKFTKGIVLAPATEKFQANVKEVTDEKIVGQWSAMYYDGCMTSAMQEALLKECDKLIAAFNEAHQNANKAEVQTMNVGAAILNRLRNVMGGPASK